MTRRISHVQTFPVTVEDAYDAVLAAPLTSIFSRRYLAIVPISEVSGQQGEWGSSTGQTRTIHLADGATMFERLIRIDRPQAFAYEMTEITGKLKPLVASAIGTWTFEPVGTGVRITWSWDVEPRGTLGRLAMPVFAKLWKGYARQGMQRLETMLTS